MSMKKDIERLKNVRLETLSHHIGADVVEEMKALLAEEADERMDLGIYLGVDKKGLDVVHLVFTNEETGTECGEFNSSCPDPPFPNCG